MQLEKLLMILPFIFISGILDAIVGGGALISIPTYIVAGLPTHNAYGTNKFASFLGTFTSAVRYIKEKRVDIKSVAIICMIASGFGARYIWSVNGILWSFFRCRNYFIFDINIY